MLVSQFDPEVRVQNSAAIISLVVVLPQLPVMPTTGTVKRPRQPGPDHQGGQSVADHDDGYGIVGAGLTPAPTRNSLFHQHAPDAPQQGVGNEIVAVVRSPLEGMKSSPVWQVRESVETPQKVSQAPGCTKAPPVAARISEVVKVADISVDGSSLPSP